MGIMDVFFYGSNLSPHSSHNVGIEDDGESQQNVYQEKDGTILDLLQLNLIQGMT